MHYPQHVKLVEVGPRDGLQNEIQTLSTADKIQFIDQLSQAGFPIIEAGSFVSAKRIPQLADSAQVFAGITRKSSVIYSALVPNLQGMQAALQAGVDEVAVFTAASEAFTQKNIHCGIQESLERFQPVIALAQQENIKVRGYISCVAGCPYSGAVPVENVVSLATRLIDMGCYQISLGDTIGIGTPAQIEPLLHAVLRVAPNDMLAIHFHDTYGQALANILRALQMGISTIDSAIAGLGGCPYARGASGNVATEDVLYLLHGLGIATGIDLQQAIAVGHFICTRLGRATGSKVARAYENKTSDN